MKIDWFDVLAWTVISLAAMSLFVGCGTSRTQDTKSGTDREERVVGSGTFGTQPFTFDVTRSVTESTQESQQSQTKLEVPELAAALSTALRTSFPQIGALLGSPEPKGNLTELILGITTALGGGVAIHRQLAASRASERAELERKRAEEHKADAAEGWEKAVGRTTTTHHGGTT